MQDPNRNAGNPKFQKRKSGVEWGCETVGGVAIFDPDRGGIIWDPAPRAYASYDMVYHPQKTVTAFSPAVQPSAPYQTGYSDPAYAPAAQAASAYNAVPLPQLFDQNSQPNAPYITGYSGPSRSGPSAPPPRVVFSDADLIPTGEVLGPENFGEVKKYIWCSPQGKIPVAVKTVTVCRTPNALDIFKREIAVHERLDPRFVVNFFGIVEQDGVPRSIVMEFMEYGSLQQLLERFPNLNDFAWTHRLHVALQTAEAIHYLHTLHPPVVHGDIKPHNILVTKAVQEVAGDFGFLVKLGDFGLALNKSTLSSQFSTQGIPDDPKGTFAWLAPEILVNPLAKRNEAGDIYAFGIVMWEIAANGRLPYLNTQGNDALIIQCKKNGINEPFDDETTPGVSPAYAKLSYDCWNKDAQQRPTAQQVVTRLRKLNLSGNISADSARDKLAVCIALRRGDAESKRRAEALLKELIVQMDGYIGIHPQHWEFLEIRGAAKVWSNEYKEYDSAEADIQKALNINHESDFAWAYLGAICAYTGKYNEGEEYCERAIRLNSENALAWRMKGLSQYCKGNWENSIVTLTKASQLDPGSAKVWSFLGKAKNELKRYKEAIADAKKASELEPTDADAWIGLAYAYRMLGDADTAIGYYDKAIECDPKVYWSWAQRGATQRMLGKHNKAIADCTHAIEIDSTCYFAYIHRADAYRLKEDFVRALEDCNSAAARFSECSWIYLCRGQTLYALGRYEEAMRDARRCLKIDQQYWDEAKQLTERCAEKIRAARKEPDAYKGHASSSHGMYAAGTQKASQSNSQPVVRDESVSNRKSKGKSSDKCLLM